MSLRLNAVVEIATPVDTAADIGCDHGKTGAALLRSGKAGRVIFGDISEKSLEKARNLIREEALEERASFRVGDGLCVLENGEADAAVLAGMGGELIARLLEEGYDRLPGILILSCNTKPIVLRRMLCGIGYAIKDEELIFEDTRFYPVILAVREKCRALDETELEFGPVVLEKKPESLMRLVNAKIMGAVENREKILRYGTPSARERLGEIDSEIKRYKELREWLRR